MYQFGPFQLDPHSNRLFKKGVEIEVEAQLIKSLVLLVNHRDRLVTKDEMLSEIWQDRVVTDSVLTRTVYELRKILDVENESSSCIRTVRRNGYQFVAKVIETDASKNISESVDESKQFRSSRFVFKSLIITVVAVILWFVVVNFFGLNQQYFSPNVTTNPPPLKIYRKVAILPIELLDDNPEVSMLVQSLIDYLANQLSVNLSMKVIPPDSLVSMSSQINDIEAIQKATQSDFIIQGLVESVDKQKIYIQFVLYKTSQEGALTPFTLGTFEFPYPKSTKDLNDLYKQRKITVRTVIEIIKPGIVVKDSDESETDDPEAYRLAIAAYHMSRADNCGDLRQAETLLLKAIDKDDKFAYAYYRLFANYFKRVWLCGESKDYHLKALAMAEIVERLAPNTYYPMYKGMHAILVESNQVEKAFELSKNADWNDPDALNPKVYGLRYAGFLNLASEHIDRILQLDPYYFSEKPINQAPNTLMYQNRFFEYMALLAEPGSSYHDYYRGLSLALTAKPQQAIDILQGVINRKSAGLFDKLSAVLLLIIKQKYPDAIIIVDDIIKQRDDKKLTDGEMTYKLVQLYALAGSKAQALKYLQRSVDQGFFPMNYFLNDPALDSIKNTNQFYDIINQATQRHEAFAVRFGLKSEARTE